MRFFAYCENCRGRKTPDDTEHRSFIIKQRKYNTKGIKGFITSKSLLCGKCYQRIKEMLPKS